MSRLMPPVVSAAEQAGPVPLPAPLEATERRRLSGRDFGAPWGMWVLIGFGALMLGVPIVRAMTATDAMLATLPLLGAFTGVLLAWCRFLERRDPPALPDVLFAACWGAFAAGVIALVVSSFAAFLAGPTTTALLVAPVVEELVKTAAVVVIALWVRPVDGPLGGLVTGTLVGLGFTVVENLTFAAQSPEVGVEVVTMRLLVGAFVHVLPTALIGAAVGSAVGWSARRHVPVGVSLLAVLPVVAGMAAGHAWWNAQVTAGVGPGLLAVALALPITYTAVSLVLGVRATRACRRGAGQLVSAGVLTPREANLAASLRVRRQSRRGDPAHAGRLCELAWAASRVSMRAGAGQPTGLAAVDRVETARRRLTVPLPQERSGALLAIAVVLVSVVGVPALTPRLPALVTSAGGLVSDWATGVTTGPQDAASERDAAPAPAPSPAEDSSGGAAVDRRLTLAGYTVADALLHVYVRTGSLPATDAALPVPRGTAHQVCYAADGRNFEVWSGYAGRPYTVRYATWEGTRSATPPGAGSRACAGRFPIPGPSSGP